MSSSSFMQFKHIYNHHLSFSLWGFGGEIPKFLPSFPLVEERRDWDWDEILCTQMPRKYTILQSRSNIFFFSYFSAQCGGVSFLLKQPCHQFNHHVIISRRMHNTSLKSTLKYASFNFNPMITNSESYLRVQDPTCTTSGGNSTITLNGFLGHPTGSGKLEQPSPGSPEPETVHVSV